MKCITSSSGFVVVSLCFTTEGLYYYVLALHFYNLHMANSTQTQTKAVFYFFNRNERFSVRWEVG